MIRSSYLSAGRRVPVEIYSEREHGAAPAVVIVYGTRGMNPPWGSYFRALARKLVAAGLSVLIPHYFAATGTRPARSIQRDALVADAIAMRRAASVSALRRCLDFAAVRRELEPPSFGIVGFSLGGHLALRLALCEHARVGAAVSFYAPIDQPPWNGIGADLERMPAVQLHHGTSDGPPVSPEESRALERRLIAAGKVAKRDYEIHFYDGQKHGFTGQSRTLAEARTIEFLKRRLGAPLS